MTTVSLYVSGYTAEAFSSASSEVVDSHLVLSLDARPTRDGRPPAEDTPAVNAYVIFSDPPPVNLGFVAGDGSLVVILPYAGVPAWTVALAELPAQLDLIVEDQAIQDVFVYHSDAGRRTRGLLEARA